VNWALWAYAAIITVSTLGMIAMIGKPRKPLDPGTAVISLVINAPLVALLLYAGWRLHG
jgi:hypothetical protein